MKKGIVFAAIILLPSVIILGQVQEPPTPALSNTELAEMYRIKAKKQKIIGIGLFLVGTGLVFWDFANTYTLAGNSEVTMLGITGIGMGIVAIPFGVSARQNKDKARAYLTNQPVSSNIPLPGIRRQIPALGIQIDIGK